MKCAIVLACLIASGIAAPGSWRIVGGKNATEGQFPYQISLRYDGGHSCGGSILDETTILSAAHCVHSTPHSSLTVTLGNNNIHAQTEVHQIAKIIAHENYEPTLYKNDICIIKLQTPIKFRTGVVEPVKLRKTDIGEEAVILSGWGLTSYPWGKQAEDLQFLNLKTISIAECKSKHSHPVDGDIEVCTLTKTGEGTCQSDSGGPLVDENKEQVGVVSWGIPCAVGLPDVYTRVYSFLDWIEANRK